MNRRFDAPWWAWVLTIVLCAALARLGFWQLHRAEEKKAMLAVYEVAREAPAQPLAPGGDAQYRQHVWVEGALDSERTVLLDNQVSRGQPGYHVWSPLQARNGDMLVLVDRGWIPGGAGAAAKIDALPVARITGVWQPLPRAGLRLGDNDCDRTIWPHVVQYPAAEELECLLGQRVADGILRLDPEVPGGFRREWTEGAIPPERHYGYAVTWFSLALTLAVIFLIVNTRRIPS